jgi:hypothetical protein
MNNDAKHDTYSKVGDACEIIRALLPDDHQWHAVKPIFDVCAERGIGERTVERAKARLSIGHRRRATFPASFEWRWLPVSTESSATSGPGDAAHWTHWGQEEIERIREQLRAKGLM